jgi:predicted house-cleaning noncanonical NTP pyrophosphatase (MazG superfamily)
LEAKGISLHKRAMEIDEFLIRLKEKLIEEAQEVQEAHGLQHICDELADVLEVIHTLATAMGTNMQQIETLRLQKRERNGGFEHRLYGASIDIDLNHPEISYYTSRPEQYPTLTSDTR